VSSRTKVSFRDRLRDRGFIDQWAFLLFATVGFVAIVSAKWFGAEARWITVGAVGVMLLYALVTSRGGTGRLRADQAGDNCYYLGLIYTLASLSYAIATFDPNGPASTIVQGFGIALATTIVGLILRVFFNQGRPDLENTEEQARLELTEATARIKRELSSVSRQMNDLGRQLDQSTREVHDAATKSMQDFANTSVQGIQSVVNTANEAIRAEANDFATRSKSYTAAFSTLLSKLQEHSDKLEGLKTSHDALLTTARLAAESATTASSSVDNLSRSAVSIASVITSIDSAADGTRRIIEQVLSSTAALETGFTAIRGETERQLAELRSWPSQAIRHSVEDLQVAVGEFRVQVSHFIKMNDDAGKLLAGNGAASVDLARRHNEELELELKRSRNLVNRVHLDLADMTGRLADSVERG
jgi:hypothetical protein